MGAPEGLSSQIFCPLDGTTAYTLAVAANALTITCPNAAAHAGVVGAVANYSTTLAAPAAEAGP